MSVSHRAEEGSMTGLEERSARTHQHFMHSFRIRFHKQSNAFIDCLLKTIVSFYLFSIKNHCLFVFSLENMVFVFVENIGAYWFCIENHCLSLVFH